MPGLRIIVEHDRRHGRQRRRIIFPQVGLCDSYIRALIAAASEVFHIRPDIILEGPRWHQECFTARAVVMYLSRVRGFSTMRIGKFFSRDHTSVLYMTERLEERIPRDTELRESMLAVARLMSERGAA